MIVSYFLIIGHESRKRRMFALYGFAEAARDRAKRSLLPLQISSSTVTPIGEKFEKCF